jgi:hypothetical protein
MLSDIITSGAMHSLKSVFQKKKERNVIIDPFSCLVKLSLIKYLDEGTKVSIYQNRLNFNTPSYIQGFVRFMYGDNREDLHNILLPIQKCVEWYWNEKDNDIVYMFNNAVLGLKFLKNSYSTYATIQHTIDYYIIILMQKNTTIMSKMGINSIDIEKLTNAILNNDDSKTDNSRREESKKDDSRKDDSRKDDSRREESKKDKKKDAKEYSKEHSKEQKSNEKPFDGKEDNGSEDRLEDRLEDRISIQTRDIHKFLYELWNQREINIVINLYKEMENKQEGTERDYIYNNIMQYCEMKENKVYKYIEDNSSIL